MVPVGNIIVLVDIPFDVHKHHIHDDDQNQFFLYTEVDFVE